MSLNPLEQLNLVTIAAVAALWLATYVALRRVLFVPLLAVMARRQQRLDAAAAVEEQARLAVERAQQDAAKLLADAKDAAERVERAAKDELVRRREAALAEAHESARAVSARGRDEIARMRADAHARLETQLVECARMALGKVTETVDDAALRVIVGSVLAGGRR